MCKSVYVHVYDPCAVLGLLMFSIQGLFSPGVEISQKTVLQLEDCSVSMVCEQELWFLGLTYIVLSRYFVSFLQGTHLP